MWQSRQKENRFVLQQLQHLLCPLTLTDEGKLKLLDHIFSKCGTEVPVSNQYAFLKENRFHANVFDLSTQFMQVSVIFHISYFFSIQFYVLPKTSQDKQGESIF